MMLNGVAKLDWKTTSLIAKCCALLPTLDNVSCCLVQCKGNYVVDRLVGFDVFVNNFKIWSHLHKISILAHAMVLNELPINDA